MCGYKRITLAQLEKAYSKGIVALCSGDRKVVNAGKEE